MSAPRTLADLRDIHVPPTPGESAFDPFWLVIVVLLLAAGLIAWGLRHHRRRLLRQSLRELAAAERDHAAGGEPTALLRTLARLLRRHARCRDAGAAALLGDQWLAFLDARGGGEFFRRGPGACLAESPYRAPGTPVAQLLGTAQPGAVAELVGGVRQWLCSNP